jgi:hypothetical protein
VVTDTEPNRLAPLTPPALVCAAQFECSHECARYRIGHVVMAARAVVNGISFHYGRHCAHSIDASPDSASPPERPAIALTTKPDGFHLLLYLQDEPWIW